MLQCSIYLKILYTPRGVESQIKRQGGCFLESLYFVQKCRGLGNSCVDHYVRQNWWSPKLYLGGGGRLGENKPLKMLGFLCQFDTISHGFRLPILRVANLLTAFHKLRSIKNG